MNRLELKCSFTIDLKSVEYPRRKSPNQISEFEFLKLFVLLRTFELPYSGLKHISHLDGGKITM